MAGDDIIFLVNGENNRNLAIASWDDGRWGTAYLTQEKDYVDAFSVNGGKICYLLNSADVAEGVDFKVYSSIKVLDNTNIADIELEDTDFSTADVFEGAEFPVDLWIKNNGSRRVRKAAVSVTNNGKEIANSELTVDLMPGECKPYEYSFDLPKDMSSGDFEITVSVDGDVDTSNNAKTIALKKADLEVHAKLDTSEEKPVIVVYVENKGTLDSNMTMTIKDEEGTTLFSESGVAGAGQLMIYREEYESPKTEILQIEVTGDAEEFYLMNNTTSVKVEKTTSDEEEPPVEEPSEEIIEDKAFSVAFENLASDHYEGIVYNEETEQYETVFTGSAITPSVAVMGFKGRLREGVDYTVAYSGNVSVSEKAPATVTITGKGDYEGKQTLKFYIQKADLEKLLSKGKLVVPSEVKLQSGKKAAPVIRYGEYTLKGADYTLSNAGAIKKDTTIDITGKGNFTGTISNIRVKVLTPAEVKNMTIKVAVKANKRTYNGQPQTLSVSDTGKAGELTVTAGASKDYLKEGVDFDVTYENNTDAGKAVVTVKAKGEYFGTVSKTFTISPDAKCEITAELKKPDETIYYDENGAKPAVVVTRKKDDGSKVQLLEGKDYTVTYSNNKKVGTGKYVVKFAGNYKGHAAIKNQTFAIKAASFAKASAVCADMIYNKPGKYLSAPMVMLGDKLLSAVDYTVQYYDGEFSDNNEITGKKNITLADGEKARNVVVVITGKGNYQSQKIFTGYKVLRTDAETINLSKAKIVAKNKAADGKDVPVADQDYTGAKIEPEVRVLVQTGKNKWEEVNESCYSVTYVNNVRSGNATIIVTGNGGGACGSAKCTFKISKRRLSGFKFLHW